MIIGITGGIGSGKSVISNELRRLGYTVYDTDKEAKRLIMEDAHVRKQITELFGSEVYKDDIYQTAIVAQQVFADKTLLARLNGIVHPAVRHDIQNKFRSAEALECKSTLEPIFVECAILYTAGIADMCDKVIAVTAPEDIRLKRVIARDHTDIEKVRARMRAQRTEEDLCHADIIVNNDSTTSISTLCQELVAQIKK